MKVCFGQKEHFNVASSRHTLGTASLFLANSILTNNTRLLIDS